MDEHNYKVNIRRRISEPNMPLSSGDVWLLMKSEELISNVISREVRFDIELADGCESLMMG